MSTEANKQFIIRYLEAFSGKPKPRELLEHYIADQTLIEHALVSEAAFPEYFLDIEEIVAEGDLVSVRGRVRGTHKGDFMGIPPTNKSFDISIYITYRVSDGKIVDHWMLLDSLALMQQLGVMAQAAS